MRSPRNRVMGRTGTKEAKGVLEVGQQAVVDAVRSGSLESLQDVLTKAKNADERKRLINIVDMGGTILHLAAKFGRGNIIEWLLSEQGGRAAGFDRVLTESFRGDTALQVAAEKGHLEAFKAIVNGCREENGEREKLINALSDGDNTVLHCAAERGHEEVVSWLLSEEGGRAAGFRNIFSKNSSGYSALYLASLCSDLDAFQAVVDGCRTDNGERGAMLNAVDNEGRTLLHFALDLEQPEVTTWLLSAEGGGAAGFDRSNVTAHTKTWSASVLHIAAGSAVDSIRSLLSHCTQQERMNLFLAVDKNGFSALCYPVRYVLPDCITELFKHPESSLFANRKDNLGMTVLHRGIIGGLDEQSKDEWVDHFRPVPQVIAALLGSAETGWTSVDPNIGLGLE